MRFCSGASLLPDIARGIAPRIRRSVSETAAAVVRVPPPSGAIDYWDPQTTPYMVEPMDCLESYVYKAVIFVGPAQCGKTNGLIDCWLAHVITTNPSRMMIVQATQMVARDYERDNWRPLRRNSPEIAAAVVPGSHGDNTYDKLLRTGQSILFRYPSENMLQGKAIPRLALTDLDRMPDDIGGQGHPFDLSLKRARTFHFRGTVLGESSPGQEQQDPHWRPATAHQAPPAPGIFSFYNLGDRRRLYWPCPHCGEYFMAPPGPEHFVYDVDHDLLGTALPETLTNVSIACPHCASVIGFEHRTAMLATAKWVPDGCAIDAQGRLDGAPPQTDIASFWLHGVHAAFVDWTTLVRTYLQAKAIFDATGSESSLRTVIMQDFGAPYVSRARISAVPPADLQARSEDYPPRAVPPQVRYLVAIVDVQAHYFSVMVIGHAPNRERWIVDRYEITESARSVAGIDPAAYTEDWETVTERCVLASYPLAEEPHRRMNIRTTLVDTGGRGSKHNPEQSVTRRAYDWFRTLRRKRLDHRVALVKGRYQRPDTPGRMVTESRPDNTSRSDRHSDNRGDVPLYLLHVNALKDALHVDLQRTDPGPGCIHLPRWWTANIFDELAAEVRGPSGWEQASGQRRNEAWDQLTYDQATDQFPQDNRGLVRLSEPCVRIAVQADRIDWTSPPAWA